MGWFSSGALARFAAPVSGIRPRTGRLPGVLLLLILLFGATGCVSYRTQTNAMNSAWERGDPERSARLASQLAGAREGTRDEVIWRLEEGSTHRVAGQWTESMRAFDQATDLIRQWDDRPPVLVGQELTASLTNLSHLPYRGYAYDRIMLHTYQALNAMHLEQWERARVEFNRALQAQRDAVDANARRIEREREAIREQSRQSSAGSGERGFDPDRAAGDARFQRQFDRVYQGLDEMSAYADYVNPFAVYLDGLFFKFRPDTAADLERARVSLRRVAGMVPGNTAVQEDLAGIEELLQGRGHPPLTYVIFETGQGPLREEVRIDFPLYLFSGDVPYVGAAFPQLRFRGNYLPVLNVRAGGQNWPTQTVARMDAVIAREFADELPLVTTKTLAAAGVQAAAVYGLREAARRESQTFGALVNLAGMIYQYAMNQADLRQWSTLPKEFQIARFPTPEDRVVELFTTGRDPIRRLELPPGQVHLILIRSITPQSPLHLSLLTLK